MADILGSQQQTCSSLQLKGRSHFPLFKPQQALNSAFASIDADEQQQNRLSLRRSNRPHIGPHLLLLKTHDISSKHTSEVMKLQKD